MDDKTPDKQDAHAVADAHRRSKHPFLRYLLLGFSLMLLLGIGGAAALAVWVGRLAPDTPDLAALLKAREAKPSILLSADGTKLATFGRGVQQSVGIEKVSTYVIQALIATEDHRFYEHHGIDIQRTLAAVLHTAGGDEQGGSTITQQLARNMFPQRIGHARTIERKLREMITAVRIERAYSKDQILETYLNTVPFLYNVVGIEMAARTYFGKHASDLDALESATLIGMLKGTSYYNPVLNPERARQRRNVVLGQMVRYGMLSAAEYRQLSSQPLHVTLHRQPDPLGPAPHFAAYVRREAADWADRHGYNLETDGLVIVSTLDDRLQQQAQQAVDSESRVLQDIAGVEWGRSSTRVASFIPSAYTQLSKEVQPFSYFWHEHQDLLDQFIRETPQYRKAVAAGQPAAAVLARLRNERDFIADLKARKTHLEAGFVAMDPNSGAIKAWVGSRNFATDQFDHVAQAERQPGSTFKPIVYGAALEHGLHPDRLYTDGPIAIPLADGKVWRPTDMVAGTGQQISMREGLIHSRNTVTAQVLQDTGVHNVVELARAVGVNQSRLDPVPSLALGTSPVTLLEMVSAYSTIADLGQYRKPLSITRILDRDGKVLAEFNGDATRRAMSEDTAIELLDMLHGVVERGTGTAIENRFHIMGDVAGKTGTTQNNTDGWFILMHPDLVAGAWVGFNDARVTMRSDYWGQGGHNAVLLVGDFFRDALKAKLVDPRSRFPEPLRPPPLIVQAPSGEWNGPPGDNVNLPPGYGVISQGGSAVLIGPDGVLPMPRDGGDAAVANADNPHPDSAGPDHAANDDALGRFLASLERKRHGEQVTAGATGSGASGTFGTGQAGAPPEEVR